MLPSLRFCRSQPRLYLHASLQRALATRQPDRMAIQRYPIRRPAEAGGGVEVRYWSPLNTPVLGPTGDVRLPEAEPVFFGRRWQDQPELLRGCDLVIGCVDTFAGRHELEVACRRYGMPYIDIGMEAQRYGSAGGRPQVVWPNGVLASTAVGLAVEIVTGWTGRAEQVVYMTYDGNTGELRPHPRLGFLRQGVCPHFGLVPSGDPVFRPVRQEHARP